MENKNTDESVISLPITVAQTQLANTIINDINASEEFDNTKWQIVLEGENGLDAANISKLYCKDNNLAQDFQGIKYLKKLLHQLQTLLQCFFHH